MVEGVRIVAGGDIDLRHRVPGVGDVNVFVARRLGLDTTTNGRPGSAEPGWPVRRPSEAAPSAECISWPSASGPLLADYRASFGEVAKKCARQQQSPASFCSC